MFVSCFFSVTNILLTDHLTRRNIQIHHLQPQKGWRNTCVLMMKKNGLFLCESRNDEFRIRTKLKINLRFEKKSSKLRNSGVKNIDTQFWSWIQNAIDNIDFILPGKLYRPHFPLSEAFR